MVVDVAGFTNPGRTLVHQTEVQLGLYRILHEAFAASGIPWDSCTVEDRGDGAMILIPPTVPKILLADPLPDRMAAALRRYNALRSTEASVQLRIGLHAGEVHENENGVVSPAVNFAFRILDASAAKTALRESASFVAFIASDHFYEEVISQDPAADPAAYRRIGVTVKNVSTTAWLRLTGTTTTAPPAESFVPIGTVLSVLPESGFGNLIELLSGVTVPHLPTLVRRAAGAGAPMPVTDDAWDVFVELNDVNAGPDGIPPALVFLALLAEQVGADRKAGISAWVAGQARRLRLEAQLNQRVLAASRLPAKPLLHLLILLEPHGIDLDRYRLSFWRQDDPELWPPPRGDGGEAALDEIEYRVDELVLDAERVWSDREATVALEFLLPRRLMSLPVHEWRKEHGSSNPRPLCLDYPIVLRSLDRMRARHWRRVWLQRWRTLMEDPSSGRVHFGQPLINGTPYRVDALLSDPQWVSMVLSAAPLPEPRVEPGMDEFTAAMQSGLPALIWHSDAPPEKLREAVHGLLDGSDLAHLPERVQLARRTAFTSPIPVNVNIPRGLVVLWDDPRRLVDFDHSAAHPLQP